LKIIAGQSLSYTLPAIKDGSGDNYTVDISSATAHSFMTRQGMTLTFNPTTSDAGIQLVKINLTDLN